MSGFVPTKEHFFLPNSLCVHLPLDLSSPGAHFMLLFLIKQAFPAEADKAGERVLWCVSTGACARGSPSVLMVATGQ